MLMQAPTPLIAPVPEEVRWLVSPEALPFLSRAAQLAGEPTARAKDLRRDLTLEQARLVLEQAGLRHKAREKFAAAADMFFTPKGLEQASDEIVADYKAQRFADARSAFDLGAGIGGDLLALARTCETLGFERDPVCAAFAEANLRTLPRSARSSEVRLADLAEADLSACDAWHVDPDRRPNGRRTTRTSAHEPSADTIDRLLAVNPHAAVKLAPAAECPRRWSERAELEWISRSRQCRQLVAWFGRLATEPGKRRATIVGASSAEARSLVGMPDEEVPVAASIDRYLYEPDAAVLAARLAGALAAEHGLEAIAPEVAYWTSSRAIDDALVSVFEVEDVLPLDTKKLKAMMRSRDVGQLEIKARGVDLDPAELRKRLRPQGEHAATLLVARGRRRTVAILARRMSTQAEALSR
jgi:hypothetical protein